MLAYPVQAFWRLPVFAHAGIGILEGLTRGLKAFVITPKRREQDSFIHILSSQRLVLGVSALTFLPAASVLMMRPEHATGLVIAATATPLLTIAALFLVPSTQWLRAKLRTRSAPAG